MIAITSYQNIAPPPTAGSGSCSASKLPYCRATSERFDFVAELLRSIGFELAERALDDQFHRGVIKAVGDAEQIIASARDRTGLPDNLVVCAARQAQWCGSLGAVFPLGDSYGALRARCRELVD